MPSEPNFGAGAEFGIMDVERLTKEFPAVTQSVAISTAREAGLDPSDPRNIVKAMHSRTFQSRIKQVREDREGKFIRRIIGETPQLPSPNAPAAEQLEGLRGAQEGTVTNRIKARGILGERTAEAEEKLAELADLDRETYKQARVKELDPDGGISTRILNLRMQAFTAKAMLRNQFKDLRPSLRNAAIAARMQIFSDAISTLKEVKDAKKAAAEEQAESEFNSKMETKRTAQARVNALQKLMDNIEETGEDVEALAGIRMDYLKESKKLEKASGDGVTDEVAMVRNAILNKYRKDNPDYVPGTDEIKEADRQAKEVVALRNKVRKQIPGKGSAIAGIRSMELMDLPQPTGLPVYSKKK